MYNITNFDYELISSSNFYVDSIVITHRVIDPPSTSLRYASEHKHDKVIHIVSGAIRFYSINIGSVTADEGSTVYIPYNISYRTEWLGNVQGEFYSVNYTLFEKTGYQITPTSRIHIFSSADKNIFCPLFEECYNNFQSEVFGHELMCKISLLKLLFTLSSSKTNFRNSKVGRAIRYINMNFKEDTSVSELAGMCNLGECMFRRNFKNETGVSPLKYRNNLRIKKAYELLTIESYSVAEAMEKTGFYDSSYFNKLFKANIGVSPSLCKKKRFT